MLGNLKDLAKMEKTEVGELEEGRGSGRGLYAPAVPSVWAVVNAEEMNFSCEEEKDRKREETGSERK